MSPTGVVGEARPEGGLDPERGWERSGDATDGGGGGSDGGSIADSEDDADSSVLGMGEAGAEVLEVAEAAEAAGSESCVAGAEPPVKRRRRAAQLSRGGTEKCDTALPHAVRGE